MISLKDIFPLHSPFKDLSIIEVVISIFILTTCSCIDSTNKNFGKKSLQEVIEVDSFETIGNHYVGSQWIESTNSLLFWYPNRNEIKLFDIQTKKINKIITPSILNPTSVRTIYYLAPDSLLLYSHDSSFTLYLIDQAGLVRNEYKLIPRFDRPVPRIECSFYESGNNLFQNGKLFVSGYSVGEHKDVKTKFSGIWINLKTKDYDYFLSMPKLYFKHYWGGIYYWHTFATGNLNNQIIFSYPASHEIISYNTKTSSVSIHEGGSSFIKKITPLLRKRLNYIKEIKEDAIKYYFTTPSYSFITFDKYQNVYYRMALFPNKNYGSRNSLYKPSSIIILDSAFNFLGETMLPANKEYRQNIIVSKQYIIVPYFNPLTKQNGISYFVLKNIIN